MKKLKEILNENDLYDKLLKLEKQYEEEQKKIDQIVDFKTWNLKTKLLFNHYLNEKSKITNKKNPYSLEGDMSASYIYHYTTGESLINIIDENILMGGGDEYGGISFTTHPNLYKRGFVFWHPNEYSEGKHNGNVGVKIKFDFNKMKKDGLKFKIGSENIGTLPGENELRLKQNELSDPLKYISEIIIFKNKEKNYRELSSILKTKNIKFKIV